MNLLRYAAVLLLVAVTIEPAAAQTGLPNGDFEAPMIDESLAGWGGAAPYRLSRDTDHPFQGEASGRIDAPPPRVANTGFGTIATSIDAAPYRGKRIRFRAAVRTTLTAPAMGALWLRVDRPDGTGFFDNMADRPIRDSQWRSYEITGNVAEDAKRIALGLMLIGGGSAWIDDVHIDIVGDTATPSAWRGKTYKEILLGHGPVRPGAVAGDAPPRPLAGRGLANLSALARAYGYTAHFSATDQAEQADWPLIAIQAVEQVEPSRDAATLARNLNATLQPYAPDFCAYAPGDETACESSAPANATGASSWHHHGRQFAPDNIYKSVRVASAAIRPDQYLTVDLGRWCEG